MLIRIVSLFNIVMWTCQRSYVLVGALLFNSCFLTLTFQAFSLTTALSNGPATVTDLWKAQIKRTEYAKDILNSWAATKTRTGTGREMDALLIPCTVWPASEK